MADDLWYMQFDVTRWQRDVDHHPLDIRGAWVTICCRLWWSNNRGELTLRPERWASFLGTDLPNSNRIIDYLLDEKICDGQRQANGYITLVSRRMIKDNKNRELNRLRQQRYYYKNKSNASLTPIQKDLDRQSKSKSNIKKEIYKEKVVVTAPEKTKFLDCVFLTEKELEKLKTQYGENLVGRSIEMLNNYKMAMGKKYKSDYHALLNWAIDKAGGNNDDKGHIRSSYRRGKEPERQLTPDVEAGIAKARELETAWRAKKTLSKQADDSNPSHG